MIEKHGTVLEKAVLLATTAQNPPHKEKRTFVLCDDARAGGCVRRPNKIPRRQAIEERRETVAEAFGDVFGGVVPDA